MDHSTPPLILRLALLALLGIAAPLAADAEPRFARGLLWKVGKAGVKPSYVFGTLHAADVRLSPLPPPVDRAFAHAKSLTLEFIADDYGRQRFLEAAMFLDRQTLEEKIGREDFERVVERLAPLELKRELVARLKPWGVLLNLRNARTESDAATTTIDGLLYDRARARRVPLHQMEGIEEQVYVFDDFPMESQVALLKHSLAHYEELSAMSEQTLQAYLARDLAALWRVQEQFMARYPEIAPHNAGFVKRILHDRNVVMAFRMQRQLRKGEAFVALGALHLYGEKGVLALLAEDGWTVTRVY